MSPATILFLAIGTFGILIAATALLGGDLLDVDAGDGLFSTELIAVAFGAFGFGAAAANELILAPLAVVLIIGAAVAVPITAVAWLLVSRLRNMPTDGTPTKDDLVGTRGVVVTPVPVGGYGEVRVRVGGQPVKLSARASQPIPLGDTVVVLDALTDTSVVVEPAPLRA